jgi:hypothetical protein
MSSRLGAGELGGATGSSGVPGQSRDRRKWGFRRRQRLTIQEILEWADEHRRLTGRWPLIGSGSKGLPTGLSWSVIQSALSKGLRGLPGGSSLSQLLAEHRGLRGPLTNERILAWADAHHQATGEWPMRTSGRVRGVDGESWAALDIALLQGRRGLPGGSSLPRLLAASRPVRNVHTRPRMTIEQVLAWSDAYHARTGRWPRAQSGELEELPGETWSGIEAALFQGLRGLPGGVTLAQLLAEHRGAPAVQTTRPLTIDQILAWADAHHAATGRWPVEESGPVSGAPGEKWYVISQALMNGSRELPAGSSLARLLAERRGARNRKGLPALTLEQIRAWADAYRSANGHWPTARSGPVPEAPGPGETWNGINGALIGGHRGLPGGLSLAKFLHPGRHFRADEGENSG